MGQAFPGRQSQWRGFARFDMQVGGRECIVCTPRRAARGRPWVWRALFFDAWPAVDVALLERGFHVVHMDVSEMYGNEVAMRHWEAFYAWLTAEHGLAAKAVVEGFSRAGLYVYHWTALHPERVSCIYGDAPVCDIRSWPGGKGVGRGNPECWQRCLRALGLGEDEAMAYRGNPIDRLAPIAAAGIPVIHVVGEADIDVPSCENTDVLEARYLALGGPMTVIRKPDCAHHPHSLQEPAPVVEFILRHTPRPGRPGGRTAGRRRTLRRDA
jgi:pimeloyl-ACP methyl ester carboxylesterase